MSPKTSFLLGSIITALLLIAGMQLWHSSNSQPESKDSYRPLDFEEPPYSRFIEEYMKASSSNNYWIKDPIALALYLAGFPNPDGTVPDKVHVFFANPATATVIVATDNLEDDSVLAQEIRADLIKNNDIWQIAWAGNRWRCRRNAATNWWTTSLCP